jgi:hypothetical protein
VYNRETTRVIPLDSMMSTTARTSKVLASMTSGATRAEAEIGQSRSRRVFVFECRYE